MMALSFSRPWDYVVLHCGKDVENRSWRTKYRGVICVHRAKSIDAAGADWLLRHGERLGLSPHDRAQLNYLCATQVPNLGIVGTVEITDCVAQSESRWFFGPFGFRLANAKAFDRVVPCAGRLGLWRVQDEIAREVAALL